MNKLICIAAALLSCSSLLLATQAVNDLPKRIESGGHLLRTRIEGAGSPTVVMEIGLGGPLEEWAAVQAEVAKRTRTFAYDRLGSKRKQKSLTGKEIAVELHAALQTAHLQPPYILVGQSFAGVYNRIFASMYPDEVAGMLLLDPATEEFIQWMKLHHPKQEFSNERHEGWPEAVGIAATLEGLQGREPLPNVPVVIVSCTRNESQDRLRAEVLPIWTSAHENLAKQFPQGRHVITEKSGHGIQVEQPELVVDLIRQLIEHVRQSAGRHVARIAQDHR